MAKGKGKKGVVKEKKHEYTFFTAEEMRQRENKYTLRLVDLRSALNYIDDAYAEYTKHLEIQYELNEWLTYLRCDGLPKAELPPEMRLFYEKLRHFEGVNMEKTINWLLSVKERSILSQDIFNKDLTRRALINEIRPNLGSEYEKDVMQLLKVLAKIGAVLDRQFANATIPLHIINDITDQKMAIHHQIMDFFDSFTYRILSAEDSYMDTIDPISSEYFYVSEPFCMHLWALKNVPIRFAFMDIPVMYANFHSMSVKLQVPASVLKDNLSIRALHMNFDNYSLQAKSFEQKITIPIERMSAGIPDLFNCLLAEWDLYMTLMHEAREALKQERAIYEEKMEKFQQQQEQLKKNKGQDEKPKKKSKIIKPTKEPREITDDTFPDVTHEFFIREREQYEIFINSTYHPDLLQLQADELNLKRFQVLGGVYQFDFVKKPRHTDFNAFNMTWHEDQGKLEIDTDVIIENTDLSKPSTLSNRVSRMSRISRVPSMAATRPSTTSLALMQVEYDDSPYFILTVTLPDFLCLWDEPMACHFEDDVLGFAPSVDAITVNVQPAVPTSPTPSVHAAGPGAPEIPAPTGRQLDSKEHSHDSIHRPSVYVSERPSLMISHGPLLNVALTRPSVINLFRSSVFSKQPYELLNPATGLPLIDVEDFRFIDPLTKNEIRHLQRHCIPRIVSSFKFPVELKLEENDDRNKPKSKGGKLIRERTVEEDTPQKVETDYYSIERQNNPERMYPRFDPIEPLHLRYRFVNDEPTAEPEAFGELLDTLDKLKGGYLRKFLTLITVPKFKPKINFRKLRREIEQAKLQQLKALQPPEPEKAEPTIRSSDRKTTSRATSRRKSNTHLVVPATSTSTVNPLLKPGKSEVSFTGEVTAVEKEKERGDRDSKEKDKEGAKETTKKGVSHSVITLSGASKHDRYKEREREREKAKEREKEAEVRNKRMYTYAHWTTKYIANSQFNKENHELTIYTDRLGTIGFAFKRYIHFPFKFWTIEPNVENPDNNEIIFTLETQFVRCVISVTPKGYSGYVTDPTKKYVRNPRIYLRIDEPLSDFKEFKKRFQEKNINIFAESDARFYIENGYFSEKHLAAELHTYNCMALHALFIKFMYSLWNRLAERRDIVLYFVQQREPIDNMMLVRVTPENATFVDIKELCSDDVNVIKLEYTLTWRNIDHYSDLHHAINSVYLNATDMRTREPQLIFLLKTLLCGVRPLSYA